MHLTSSSFSGDWVFFNGKWYSFLYFSGQVCVFMASFIIAVTGVVNSGRNSFNMAAGMSPGTESVFLACFIFS